MNTHVQKFLHALAVAAVAFAVAATPAYAMTTEKATARPNEDGGTSVIGGIPTRLTWEGIVEDGEAVDQVTIAVPAGGSFEGSSAKVTVLDGLTRMAIEGTAQSSGNEISVSFSEAVEAGYRLRLEFEGMSFSPEGGDVQVTGSYRTKGGESRELAASKPIATIANTPLQALVQALDSSQFVKAWNEVPFLGMFFKPQLLVTSFAALVPGWLLCLFIVVAAYPFAIFLGLCFAFMKISHSRLLRGIAITYINLLRGTPLFLQIYIMFFGLPMMNININNNLLGIIVIAINASAYLAEIFRAGIESIPQGQHEAAASLGMGRMRTMVSIILPQTIRRVIPTVTSDFITSYKDTSLLSSVGVMELMMFSKNLTSVSGNMTPYVAAAIFYLIVTLPLIKVVSIVEKRMAASERGTGKRKRARGTAAADQPGESAEVLADQRADARALEPQSASLWDALKAPFTPASAMGGADRVR